MKIIKTLVILCLFAFIISAKLRKEKETVDGCCVHENSNLASGWQAQPQESKESCDLFQGKHVWFKINNKLDSKNHKIAPCEVSVGKKLLNIQ